jgi:hypothetical protein
VPLTIYEPLRSDHRKPQANLRAIFTFFFPLAGLELYHNLFSESNALNADFEMYFVLLPRKPRPLRA